MNRTLFTTPDGSDIDELHLRDIHWSFYGRIYVIFDVLRKERLFLAADKMFFFAPELKILGHVIDDKGIRMDPHKVDGIEKWKEPTNKDMLLWQRWQQDQEQPVLGDGVLLSSEHLRK